MSDFYSVRIFCGAHKAEHRITSFMRQDGTWNEVEHQDAVGKREYRRRKAEFKPAPPTGRPIDDWLNQPKWADTARPLTGSLRVEITDASIPAALQAGRSYWLFDLRCERCGDNVPRRDDGLFPVLDILRATGIRKIDLTALRSACQRFDANHERPDAPGDSIPFNISRDR